MNSNHSTRAASRALLSAMLLPLFGGCSMLTDSLARSASEMATQNAVKAIREVDLDRQVDVTLIGGRALNTGRGTVSRPVQTCIYVVQNADWRPPPALGTGECVGRERDSAVIAVERRVVAPNQVQQFQLKAPGVREAWVMVDADFAFRPADYVPLGLRIEGHGLVRVSAWLDGNDIFDGRQPRPTRAQAPGGSGEVSKAAPAAAPNGREFAATDAGTSAREARMQAALPRAMSGLPEGDAPRRLDLTLVGGRRLNADPAGTPQPVQTCAYVVRQPDWQPPAPHLAAICANPARDADVAASDCRVVTPNRLQQFQLDLRAPAGTDLWLVVDADYAQRPENYLPLRMKVEGPGPLRLSAWLEGKGVFDGREPLPALTGDESGPVQAPKAPASTRPPLQPLNPVRNKSSTPRSGWNPSRMDALGGGQ